MKNVPTITQVEAAIDKPAVEWVGNCYGIAVAVNDAFPEWGGTPLYGHYLGPVAPGSIFHSRNMGWVQHGWIELPNRTVLDPTRWAFDAPNDPYIYFGPGTHYDEGGNQNRMAMMHSLGFPAYDDARPKPDFDPPLSPLLAQFIGDAPRWSENQAYWYASQAFDLVTPAGFQYVLDTCRHGRAMIPTDNLHRLERMAAS